jgi:glycosyltransferase involved in cell wall biosynthesis
MFKLVSVIVPTFNRSGQIKDALDSIYAQDYRPIEILIMDDGSTDDTKTVVEAWTEQYQDEDFSIRYIKQSNQGGNPARNNGIQNAKGEFIAFLDSDDAWLPNKISQQIPYFEDPEVGGVYCGVQHMNFENGEILEPSNRQYPNGWLLNQILIRDVTVQTSAYMVRKSAFDKVGLFDNALLARQDWDMWIRLASEYKIDACPKVLVNFREHSGIRTASNPYKEITGYRAIRKKYSTLFRQQPIRCRLQARSAYHKRMGRVHFKHHISKPRALGYAVLSILNWPFDFDAYAALAGMCMPQNFRANLHRAWNRVFGATQLAIRSH